jgi:hypothetical protein
MRGLFDHLVGAHQKVARKSGAKRPRHFQINSQLDPRGLLDWQIGRLLAVENSTDVVTNGAVFVHAVGPAKHEAAGFEKTATRIDARYCSARREQNNAFVLRDDERVRGVQNSANILPSNFLEDSVQFAGAARIQDQQAHTKNACGALHL